MTLFSTNFSIIIENIAPKPNAVNYFNFSKSLEPLLMPRIPLFKAFVVFIFFLSCSGDSIEKEILKDVQKEESIGEFIDDWTFRVFPESPYNNFDVAEFRLWLPENRTDLKAVLILLHSANSNALGLANSPEWQAFAKKENLALCGVNFTGGSYSSAAGGSGQALLDAIEQITIKNTVPQITQLPFLMRGYSAGGNFSYNFSNFKPEKVVGLVSIRGGQLETSTKNITVPGVILTGDMEGEQRNAFLKDIALDKRDDGGLWSFAIEPDATHFSQLKASDDLARIFFSSVLKKRITADSDQLKTIPEDSGWLGNNTRTDIYTYSDYPGNKTSAFWLVDEDFANAWLNFQK